MQNGDAAAVTIEHIRAAAERLEGEAVRTPLLESCVLNEIAGGRVLLKAETFQISGSFKFRGAFNRLSLLDSAERRHGVVAWSSGNHAQGVAAAAKRLGIAALIVMPDDAPRMKIENTRAYGAEIIFYDRYTEDRQAIGTALARERGAVLVPSYDDPHLIAGQGTMALELADQCAKLGVNTLDHMLVCCGGGGLTAGTAVALERVMPAAVVHPVEPAAFDDTARSLKAGTRLTVDPQARSICDALLTPSPGAVTFPINLRLAGPGLTVTDADVRSAMVFAFRTLKLVLEPGGAVALAAVLAGKLDFREKIVGVTLSGGNVDADVFARILTETAEPVVQEVPAAASA